MTVRESSFTNFRTLSGLAVSFTPGINVIFGPNASGKTSVLEGIGYCLRGRSIVNALDLDVPTFGQTTFEVSITLEGDSKRSVSINYDGRKCIRADGKAVRSGKVLLESFKLVTMTPSTSQIALGPPVLRRDFIDETASQLNPNWAMVVTDYRATLKDRNALLKRGDNPKLHELLTSRIIELGTKLRHIRDEVIERLNTLSTQKGIAIHIASDKELSEEAFKKIFKEEAQREQTLLGPHRDDCHFTLSGKRVEHFASTGEARSAMLTLKLAQADTICSICGVQPFILADDLTAELDQDRQSEALQLLSKYSQVIITCANMAPPGDYNLIEAAKWRL